MVLYINRSILENDYVTNIKIPTELFKLTPTSHRISVEDASTRLSQVAMLLNRLTN